MTKNIYNFGNDDKNDAYNGGKDFGYGGGYGYGGKVYFNASKDGPVARDLGAGDDVVRVSADRGGQVRLQGHSVLP